MPKLEDTEWNPPKPGGTSPKWRRVSQSTLLLRSLKPGEVKRLIHEDVRCQRRAGFLDCSLHQEMKRLRKVEGWEIHYYHIEPHEMVVTRIH